MADDAGSELAKGIINNLIPLDRFGKAYEGAQDTTMKILQQLGLMPAPAPAQGMAPPLNAPLPKFNPQTGGIDYPPGYKGPR